MRRVAACCCVACGIGVLALAAPKAGRTPEFRELPHRARHQHACRAGSRSTKARLYFLTLQTDVSAPVNPPWLGHKVLVEGVISDEPGICGGRVLKPVDACR